MFTVCKKTLFPLLNVELSRQKREQMLLKRHFQARSSVYVSTSCFLSLWVKQDEAVKAISVSSHVIYNKWGLGVQLCQKKDMGVRGIILPHSTSHCSMVPSFPT